MGTRILVYGATGYSGRLIAAQAAQFLSEAWAGQGIEVVLASRDAPRLADVAREHGLPMRCFGLDAVDSVRHAIEGFHVVLNAAGPFAFTSPPLVRACILSGCHYVDISGELDVYKSLDDQGANAALRQVALVSGAGYTATLSDLMLRQALHELGCAQPGGPRLGVVELAFSASSHFSRGSAGVMLRAMREQVAVVMASDCAAPQGQRRLRLSNVPVGRLERSFDFGRFDEQQHWQTRRAIASAANLVDTLVAKRALEQCLHGRPEALPEQVLSSIEMDQPTRLAYQAGAWTSPIASLPWVRRALAWSTSLLPDGPDAAQRSLLRHAVLLRVASDVGEPLIDWSLQTPDVYELTARCALEVARSAATAGLHGWRTPAELLAADALLEHGRGQAPQWRAVQGCRLHRAQTPCLQPLGAPA